MTAGMIEAPVLDQKIRTTVFALSQSSYVERFFNIHANFVRRKITAPAISLDEAAERREFVATWRRASLKQLGTIAARDVEVAVISAGRTRILRYVRVWPEFSQPS